jgi:hypothetical protein
LEFSNTNLETCLGIDILSVGKLDVDNRTLHRKVFAPNQFWQVFPDVGARQLQCDQKCFGRMNKISKKITILNPARKKVRDFFKCGKKLVFYV